MYVYGYSMCGLHCNNKQCGEVNDYADSLLESYLSLHEDLELHDR